MVSRMRIRGEVISGEDAGTIRQRLRTCAAGLSHKPQSSGFQVMNGATASMRQIAGSKMAEWRANADSITLTLASTMFEAVCRAHEHDGNTLALGYDLQSLGYLSLQQGNTAPAMAILKKSAQLLTLHERLHSAVSSLSLLYDACISQIEGRDRNDSELPVIRHLCHETTEQLSRLYNRRHGEQVHHDALMVNQCGVGISADKPIGTTNVNDCICLMLHNPDSRRTALAHIDARTRVSSIDWVIDRLTDGDRDHPLQARLLGGCYGESNPARSINPANCPVANSLRNIDEIIAFLLDRPVDILSADICDEGQSRCVVVDPATFTVTPMVPGARHTNSDVIDGLPAFHHAAYQKDIHLCFDLTTGEDSPPPMLTTGQLSVFRDQGCGRNGDEMALWLKSKTTMMGHQRALTIPFMLAATLAYEEAAAHLQSCLQAGINRCIASGALPPAQGDLDDALYGVRGIGRFYIGAGAQNANAPYARFLQQDFCRGAAGQPVSFDLAGFYAFPRQGGHPQPCSSPQ